MTDEDKPDTEKFISDNGVKYAYAYDKGGKLKQQLGVSGIPHAFLLDASGKIVWEGHPGNLGSKDIEKALAGALPKPMFDLPAAANAVKAALQKRDYAGALAAAQKLSEADQGPTIVETVKGRITARVAAMKAAYTAGNFLDAQESAAELSKGLAGLPEKADADKMTADIKANKDADRVIKAQKSLRTIANGKLNGSKALEKAIADAKKIQKEMRGTYAEHEAEDLVASLIKRKS